MSKTIFFKNDLSIINAFSVGGPKESQGQIGGFFDINLQDDMLNEKSFEKAETKIMFTALKGIIEKQKIFPNQVDCIISGDLLNQIIASTFSARNFDCSFMGVYDACATFTESIIVGGMAVDGGYFDNVICGACSHFSSAERQYRYPLELGSTRPPCSQWTVTGAGTLMLNKNKEGIKINGATIGKIVDFGVTDANNMGSAMAPSCAETIFSHFKHSKTEPSDYDLIITGDLGTFGTRILKDLLWEKGYDISKQHVDCGELVYNLNEEEYQGGSGAGCSALVFCSYIYQKLKKKEVKRVLLVSTGALLSSLTSQQGESIPGISHAVDIGG